MSNESDTFFFRETGRKENEPPLQILRCNQENLISFYADMAIPTHYVTCEILGNKKYFGQCVLILRKDNEENE